MLNEVILEQGVELVAENLTPDNFVKALAVVGVAVVACYAIQASSPIINAVADKISKVKEMKNTTNNSTTTIIFA